MFYLFTCVLFLIHVLGLGIIEAQVVHDGVPPSKDGSLVFYVQKDGQVMTNKESLRNATDIPMHYPLDDISPGTQPSTKPPSRKIKIIHTNALMQHLTDGTKVGELKSGKADKLRQAYPWNPIVAESPKTLGKTSIRPTTSIDQVIEKTIDKTGTGVAQYPTNTGQVLTELDILMTLEQYLYYYEGRKLWRTPDPYDLYYTQNGVTKKRRIKRKALKYDFTYWPNGVIPYTIDNSFSREERELLKSSMQDWMDKTCVRFVEARSSHSDVLNIQNGQGCNSFVGRVGGKQSLNLERACRENHVMTHELGHVIGLIHEHQRPDRDRYIKVARENVGQGRLKNYRKFARDRINVYGVDYDYTSIMHYGKTAFSKDDVSTTMITLDANFQDIIGTTSKVSFKDAKIVNKMYNCAGHCKRRPRCNNGYVDTNCRCACPDGTQSCAQRLRRPRPSRTRPSRTRSSRTRSSRYRSSQNSNQPAQRNRDTMRRYPNEQSQQYLRNIQNEQRQQNRYLRNNQNQPRQRNRFNQRNQRTQRYPQNQRILRNRFNPRDQRTRENNIQQVGFYPGSDQGPSSESQLARLVEGIGRSQRTGNTLVNRERIGRPVNQPPRFSQFREAYHRLPPETVENTLRRIFSMFDIWLKK